MNSQTVRELAHMGHLENLDALRLAHPEIDCAVLVDRRAETVLCVSSHIDQPQEMLDRLSHAAAQFLGGTSGDRNQFCLATPLRIVVAQQSGTDPDIALALIFEPSADLGKARATARDACERLSV